MKIEAMTAYTEEEIKARVSYLTRRIEFYEDDIRLILAWATAKAEAERAKRLLVWIKAQGAGDYDPKRDWTEADWLSAVLQRIGWPEGEK